MSLNRVNSHRRDVFIEWIKGLLSVPFVLHAHPRTSDDGTVQWDEEITESAAHRRYAEIFQDIEEMIHEHRRLQDTPNAARSKLKIQVPSIGEFWTPLPLAEAFRVIDRRRAISTRRFVAPSFNDVRHVLNAAQLISLAKTGLKMVTFDGDVTLYNDGANFESDNPLIEQLILLLSHDIYVAILTAAGYPDPAATMYITRFRGLLDALGSPDCTLTEPQKQRLAVVGGECNYFFVYDKEKQLRWVDPQYWQIAEMKNWTDDKVLSVMDKSQLILEQCIRRMRLPATIVRKERSVGMVRNSETVLSRDQLEEAVLAVRRTLTYSGLGYQIPFCAFNGGSDVWCDIGDKRYGVLCLQHFWKNMDASNCLHVGDQFLSSSGNDYMAVPIPFSPLTFLTYKRSAASTGWISSPQETYNLIRDYFEYQQLYV